MRYLMFLFYVLAMVLMVGVFGCGTENPICTDTFCLVPRDDVTGEIIEIDDAKVLTLLNTLAVDTPAVENTGTLADIVSDTAAGGTAYNGLFVSVTGEVEDNFVLRSSDSEGLTLQSGNDSVTFFVLSRGQPDNVREYPVGETYVFSLFIAEQSPSLIIDADGNLVEAEDQWNVWGHLALDGNDPPGVSPETLIADARSENQRYQGRVVRVTDRVRNITDTRIYLTAGFFIDKNVHPDEATMRVGGTYTVDVFIVSIGIWRFANLPQVWAYLVRDAQN